ncbi:hypothetical protein J4731_01655 [Providencia rettgeri]|nr:hypothetical protein [Providencia rettgeri]
MIGLPLVAIADNIHVTVNSSMYSYPDNRACSNPFNEMYASVDVKIQAQFNASQSCQNKEGSRYFCTPAKITATVTLSNGELSPEALCHCIISWI